MSETRIKLQDGDLTLYLRKRSAVWQCEATFGAARKRVSTGDRDPVMARAKARDWYLRNLGIAAIERDMPAAAKKDEKTFAEAAAAFEAEYETLTERQRSPKWVQGHKDRLRLHLLPYFGELGLSEVDADKVQAYRVHRMLQTREVSAPADDGKGVKKISRPPAPNTLHNEIVTLRLVLQTAERKHWLKAVPDLSPPYKMQGKVGHRPWFSPAEYKQLYEATRDYAHKCAGTYYEWDAAQLHDYVLFLANTGLRPDEAKNLQHRDVSIVHDPATNKRILEIEIEAGGKVGYGPCKSTPGAVLPYERLRDRPLPPEQSQTHRARRERGEDISKPAPAHQRKSPQPTDKVFPGDHIKMFNNLLRRIGLKFDRNGKPRTAYSLRHTYICMRLTEGADIYHVAKNCRTSVEMIQEHYAKHIQASIDTALINVMRPKSQRRKKSDDQPGKR